MKNYLTRLSREMTSVNLDSKNRYIFRGKKTCKNYFIRDKWAFFMEKNSTKDIHDVCPYVVFCDKYLCVYGSL